MNSYDWLFDCSDMRCNEDLERFRTAGIALDKQTAKKNFCCNT